MTKFYYAGTQISPAPTISINQTNNYANDTVIGYTYSVTINGYIIPITDNDNNLPGIVLDIQDIQNIFSKNGSSLRVSETENNIESNILILKGGILKSISFPDSPNNWTKYATYSATIEFNELIINNESISCNNSFIDHQSISSGLIDINKYKISQFTDGWTFNVVDENNYNYIFNNEIGQSENLNIVNTSIDLTYTINVTGQTYFDENQKLLPAWVQAKNFAQKRLYDQIRNLSTSLKLSGNTNCDTINNLSTIHTPGTENSGLITGTGSLINNTISNNNYNIYNETIQCNLSESDGTFSLTYNSKLKRNNDNSFSSNDTLHTISKEIAYNTSTGTKNMASITINGNIEGLCPGGIVKSDGNFKLPDKGFLIIGPLYNSKFTNANSLLTKILNNNQDDLSESFKAALGINMANLLLSSSYCSDSVKPSSFNLTKNYMNGTITYNIEYTTDRNCFNQGINDRTISKTNVDVELPTPIIAEFTVPGGNYVLQNINTTTAKTVTITSEGRYKREACTSINNLLIQIIQNPMILLPPNMLLPDYAGSTLKNKTFNYNPIDGTYSINLSYLCSIDCEIV